MTRTFRALSLALAIGAGASLSTPAQATGPNIMAAYAVANFSPGAIEFLSTYYASLDAAGRASWASRWGKVSESGALAAKLYWDAMLAKYGLISGLIFIDPYGGAGRPTWEDGGDLHASMRQDMPPAGGGGNGDVWEVESDCVEDVDELGNATECTEDTAVTVPDVPMVDLDDDEHGPLCVAILADMAVAVVGECDGREGAPVELVVYY